MHMNKALLGGRLGRHIALALGVASLGLASTATFAAPVDSGLLSITVPATIDGIYINIVTGATGGSGAAVPGWDNNPYNNGSGFTWFSPSVPAGQGVVGAALAASALLPGTTISGTNTFLAGQATGAAFQSAGDRYVGVRFRNEATGAQNFGYVLVRNSAGAGTNIGFPATILRTGYCNAGESVTIPASPGAPICGSGPPPGGASDIALFINNDAGYVVAAGIAKTGGITVNVGDNYSFFARVLNNLSGPVTGGALSVTIPATSRYTSATCSGSVVPTIPAGPINSPGPVNLTGINFTGRTNPPLVGGAMPLTCRFNFTAVAAGTGTHTGTVSQTSTGNVTTNDTDTFGITVNSAPVQSQAIPVNSLNAWGIAALAFLLGLVGFAVVRRRV